MAVVVITGASSGIGEATARLLGSQGHRLVLAARRAERLEALAAALSGQAQTLVVPTDVTVPGSLDELARRAAEHFGQIDVWINNSGVGEGQSWWESSPEQIRTIIETNLVAPVLGTRAVLAYMLPRGAGHIINIASVAGHIGASGVYSATKFGLRGHSEALRREVRQLGIKVSLVSPGFIRTEMTEGVPLPMPSADVVARVIAGLIKRPRREVVVPGWYRILIWFTKLFPGLTDAAFQAWDRRRAQSGTA